MTVDDDVRDVRVQWNPIKNPPVPLSGGVAAPKAFSAELDLKGGASVTMEMEVVDRRLVCSKLTVTAAKGETLRIPVQRWVETVAASVAMTVKSTGGVTTLSPPTETDSDEVGEVVSGAASRRNITRDLLERAARAHRQSGVKGVQAALDVSEAQAYRYIRKAREAGVLEPRGN